MTQVSVVTLDGIGFALVRHGMGSVVSSRRTLGAWALACTDMRIPGTCAVACLREANFVLAFFASLSRKSLHAADYFTLLSTFSTPVTRSVSFSGARN